MLRVPKDTSDKDWEKELAAVRAAREFLRTKPSFPPVAAGADPPATSSVEELQLLSQGYEHGSGTVPALPAHASSFSASRLR